MTVGVGLLGPAGPAVAASSIDRAEVCVDPDGTFRFLAEIAEPVAPEVGFRIGADGHPIGGGDVERFQVNFDTITGAITRDPPAIPEVETFGSPALDRWRDGPVDDFELTSLDAAGAWRITGGIAPGADPFVAGNVVAAVVVRPFPGTDVILTDLVVTACGAPPPSSGQRESTFTFDINAVDDVPYHLFNVLTPGTVTATMAWTGASDVLDVSLTGRRRDALPDPTAPYATATGTSPLTLTYDVTAADLGRGVGWRLVIEDGTGAADAIGTVTLTVPFDAALQADFEVEKISLRSGDLWNNAVRTSEMSALAGASAGGAHGIISLERACNCQENQTLTTNGFHRQSYLPGRHAYGLVEQGANPDAPEVAPLIAGLTPLEPEDKVDPDILVGNTHHLLAEPLGAPAFNRVVNGDGTWNLFVQFAEDTPPAVADAVIGSHSSSFDSWSATVRRADVDPTEVLALAERDVVAWIEPGPSPVPLGDNDTTRATILVDPVQNARVDGSGAIQTGTDGLPLYDGIDGSGITVAIIDDGIDGNHPDLTLVNTTTGPGKHGTHVAGIATGSGVNSAGSGNGGAPFQWRGMAPGASAWDSGSWNANSAMTGITTGSVDVANRSQTISTAGNYSQRDQILDQVVNGNAVNAATGDTVPRRLLVMSAGNNGRNNDPQRGTQAGYFSVSKHTKNSVIVGNWNGTLAGGGLAASSSMGPAYDGRLFPTVVAPGSNITSTGTSDGTTVCYAGNATNGYGPCGGTSQASPAVAGVVALMLDAWQRTYSQPLGTTIDDAPPLPATLRAILAQTATDIVDNDVRGGTSSEVDSDSDTTNGNDGTGFATATVGPDYATGFGMVDAQMAVGLVTDVRQADGVPIPNQIVQGALAQGNTLEYEFVVTDTANPFQVTLAWDDEESATATTATAPMLVNDLDLELISPDGTVFYPWQLGHTILDAAGNPLADNAQPPGTQIQVQVPISAATTTANFTQPQGGGTPTATNQTCTNALAGLPANSTCETVIQDSIPASALTGNGAWVARTGKDHLNNLEQVTVPAGEVQAGRWQARVIGFDVQTDLQDFGLVGLPHPDLPELVPSVQDTVALAGFDQNLDVAGLVENTGAVDAGGFSYQLLLSDDFAVGDDIALSAGAVTGVPAGATAGLPITAAISQAQADALLGTTGVTFDEFLAADPFLLLHVDSGDEVIEHDEANIVAAQTARAVDVMLVYDKSGSMSGPVPISTGLRQKIDVLQDSGALFYDLLRLDAGDRGGHVEFNATATTLEELTAIDADHVGTLQGHLAALTAGGATNIRDALDQALDAFPSDADDRRRVVVFFSDGEATAGGDPLDPLFLLRFLNGNVRTYSVGFGTPGGSGYSGIDVDLLQSLSDVSSGGFFRVTDQPVELDKFFVEALAGAVGRATVIDPVAELAPGEELAVDVGVTSEDGRVSFVGTWDDPSASVALEVTAPSGVTLTPSSAGPYGDQVDAATGPAHAIVEARLPVSSGPDRDHAGTWRLTLRNDGSSPVAVSSSAMAASTVQGTLLLPEPADGSRDAGDPIEFDHVLHRRDGAPIGDATVMVKAHVPLVSVGDVLSAAGVTRAEIDAVPPAIDGDVLTDVERAVIALRNRLGTDPIPTVEGAPFGLASAGGGSYATTFGATDVAGPYTFTSRASFRTADCADTTREQTSTAWMAPTVDPAASLIDLTSTGPGSFELLTRPVDTGGGYFGPALGDTIVVAPGGTLVADGPVVDLLDGSYLQVLRASGTGVGEVTVHVDGVALPTQVTATGGPVATTITPGGGSNTAPTLVTLGIGVGGSVEDVTAVRLVGPAVTSTVPAVAADPGAGTLTVQVPAGLEPGAHQFLLETVGGVSVAPLKPAEFLVVGDQDPAVLLALATTVDALANGATTDELRDLLHAVQALPLGKFLTSTDRTVAASEVLRALLGGEEQVQLPAVQRARSLAAMDARFFDLAPATTEPGQDITVNLGGDVVATFDSIVQPGTTSVAVLPGPSGIDTTRTGNPYLAYDVTTTAVFEDAVKLTFPYREADFRDETKLQLFHFGTGGWEPTTTELDTSANTISGTVSDLSLFVILEGNEVPDVDPPPSCLGFEATIVGTDGDDHLVGTPGPDVIVGLGGDDLIEGKGGDDVLCGGEGHDHITGGEGDDRIDGGAGDDVLDGGEDDDRIFGGSGHDVIDGGSGDNRVDAGPGNDAVTTGDGNDFVDLGPGDDLAATGDGADRVEGGPGDDLIEGHDGADVLLGGEGSDRIEAGDGPDLVRGGAGPDELSGDDGDDLMFGGAEDDVLYGRGGNDATHGGEGTDTCSGETQTSCEDRVKDPRRRR